MEDTLTIGATAKKWPPERGMPLFLAWMAGVIATAVFGVITTAAVSASASPGGWRYDFNTRLVLLIPVLLVHAWESWLLFRKHRVRFALWTAWPLWVLAIPVAATPGMYRIYQFSTLVTPLFEAAVLRGVRQRAWAWILAGMAGAILLQLQGPLALGSGVSFLQRLVNSIGLSGMLSSIVTVSVGRGLWILAQGISAAVLAWKMPPIGEKEEVAPPVIADSTAEQPSKADA